MMVIPISINLGGLLKVPNGMHVISGRVKIYVKDGYMHRTNGPAEIRPDGYKAWFKKGIRHRIGGPAVIHPDGHKEYWEEGKLIKNSKKGGVNGRPAREKEK
jgi:hypothetical protein